MDPLKYHILLLVGWLFVIVGAITFPLPIPVGLVLLTVGFVILIPNSRTLRRGVIALKKRWPGFREVYYKIRDRLPGQMRRKLDEEDDDSG